MDELATSIAASLQRIWPDDAVLERVRLGMDLGEQLVSHSRMRFGVAGRDDRRRCGQMGYLLAQLRDTLAQLGGELG